MDIAAHRSGSGSPLVLLHGLGGSWRSWETVLPALAAEREVVALDLPGFAGDTPPLAEPGLAPLTGATETWLRAQGLADVPLVGSSLGARMVLELTRRGLGHDNVALDPGGFWTAGEARAFHASIGASVRLLRRIRPVLPRVLSRPTGRTVLLPQLSARPWALDGAVVTRELTGYADSPSFSPVLDDIAFGARPQGAPAGTARGRLTIGWGRRDRVTLPRQAARAARAFPDATLHWFEGSGHFPMWDSPEETARVVLASTG